MAHLTNFSFNFFYKIFTEYASLLFLYHGAKKSKMTKKWNQGGPALRPRETAAFLLHYWQTGLMIASEILCETSWLRAWKTSILQERLKGESDNGNPSSDPLDKLGNLQKLSAFGMQDENQPTLELVYAINELTVNWSVCTKQLQISTVLCCLLSAHTLVSVVTVRLRLLAGLCSWNVSVPAVD